MCKFLEEGTTERERQGGVGNNVMNNTKLHGAIYVWGLILHRNTMYCSNASICYTTVNRSNLLCVSCVFCLTTFTYATNP